MSRPDVAMVPLDPKAKALLTAIAAASEPGIEGIPVEKAREQVEQRYLRMRIPVRDAGTVEDINILGPHGDIPLRVYSPSGNGPHPAIVFIHGGGWVFFRASHYDGICSHLCEVSGCVVVSVDYRRSPEYKFPVAADESFFALGWVAEHGKANLHTNGKLFLAGDSAGGNLAAVTALRSRDSGGPAIQGQILIYPVTDYLIPEKQSYLDFAEGFGLTRADMIWFWDRYLATPADALLPYAAPLRAASLSELPPALIIVAGYDPLHDEGIAYAEKLKEEGTPVTLSVYHDMIHGFLSYLGILPQASSAINDIASWINSTN